MHRTPFHVPFFLALVAWCAGVPARLPSQEKDQPVVARAGKTFITEREFLERFELAPALYRSRASRVEGDKLATLYSLIAEKLLAEEAADRQLDHDSLYQSALAEVTKLLARDELYRQEISRKIEISPGEVRQGMKQARREIRVRFLFCPDSSTIAFLRSQIRSAREFDRMVPDRDMDVIRDTATVIWGDAEPGIEEAAYGTAEGRVSEPVRAGDGWYLLRPLSARTNAFYAGLSPPVLRERVVSLLRRRKEQRREQEFLGTFLQGKRGFSPPEAFRSFASALTDVMRRKYTAPSTALSPPMADELRHALGASLHDTLVVAGSAAWTVDDVIDRLVRRGFAVSGDSARGVPARLYSVLEDMVHQELLAQEALARGLDRVPEVRRKLGPWRDHYLAAIARRMANASVKVTDAEVYAYLKSESPFTPVPEVRLRELRAPTADVMVRAASLLERGVAFGDVVRQLSSDAGRREDGGLTGFFPITERQPLGMVAAQLDSGQVYGPIRDSLGLVMIQLAGRRNMPAESDTGAARRVERGKTNVLRMKQQRVLTLFLAQSARDRGFDVYEDRLKALQVNPLPMVAYRLLGFGGRMFEVPFVEPQLEWLSTEPPAGRILP